MLLGVRRAPVDPVVRGVRREFSWRSEGVCLHWCASLLARHIYCEQIGALKAGILALNVSSQDNGIGREGTPAVGQPTTRNDE